MEKWLKLHGVFVSDGDWRLNLKTQKSSHFILLDNKYSNKVEYGIWYNSAHFYMAVIYITARHTDLSAFL